MSAPLSLAAVAIVALTLTAPLAAVAQGIYVAPELSPAVSTQPLSSQRLHVDSELRRYGFRGVDVGQLSTGQVAHIANAVHSGRSDAEVRSTIDSTLRRGLLQRGLDRVTGRR